MKFNRKIFHNIAVVVGTTIILVLGLCMELPSLLGDALNFWIWLIVIPIVLGITGRFLLVGKISLRIAILPTIPIFSSFSLIQIARKNHSGGEEIAWLVFYGAVWVLFATVVLVALEVTQKILCAWHKRTLFNEGNVRNNKE